MKRVAGEITWGRQGAAPSNIFNFKAVLHIYCSFTARSSARPQPAAQLRDLQVAPAERRRPAGQAAAPAGARGSLEVKVKLVEVLDHTLDPYSASSL